MCVVACNDKEKPTDNEVKKLPSKIWVSWLSSGSSNPQDEVASTYYHYDEQNRLVRASRFRDTVDIFYNTDGAPEKILVNGNPNITFRYSGNQVFFNEITYPKLILNDRGQVIKEYANETVFSSYTYNYPTKLDYVIKKNDTIIQQDIYTIEYILAK